jgi:two-component system, cell cycle response regulator
MKQMGSEEPGEHPHDRVTISTSRSIDQMTGRLVGSLIVIHGEELGRKYEIDGARTIGRGRDNDICFDQNAVSRYHAEIYVDETGVRLRDMGSTNGTYVNDAKIYQMYLSDADTIKIGRTVLKYLNADNIESSYHGRLNSKSNIDKLLGIGNRQSLDEKLVKVGVRTPGGGDPPTLLLLDIDHFGRCNGVWGRHVGDYVLREIARLVQQSMYAQDFVARYGGDEFAVMLHALDYPDCMRFAEQLRAQVQTHEFIAKGKRIGITISIGLAMWNEKIEGADQLIQAADTCLYRAQKAGYNRVVSNVSRMVEPDELCVLTSGDLVEAHVITHFARALCDSFEADTGAAILGVEECASEWRIRSRPGLLAAWFRKVCGIWNNDGSKLGVMAPIYELMNEKRELQKQGYHVFMTPESHNIIMTRMLAATQPTVRKFRNPRGQMSA